MKKLKTSLVVLLIAAFTTHSFAQDLREKFHFGIKAGANVSNMWDKDAQDFSADPRLGFAGGAFFSIPLGRLLAIQPEVMFSQKGFNGKGKFLGIDYKMSRTTSYVEFPILVALRPFPFLSIVAGPQFSFLVKQKDHLEIGGVSNTQEEKFKNDDWRKHQVGLHVGLDINIQHFVISPRLGLDFLDNRGEGNNTDPNYKNIYGQLTLGYQF